jgi:CRP-like cAMP-binding protein
MGTLSAPDELEMHLTAVGFSDLTNPQYIPVSARRGHNGHFPDSPGHREAGPLDGDPASFTSRHVGPGSVLGLPAALSDSPYFLTAEVVEDAELVFLRRQRLLDLYAISHTYVSR